MVVSEAGQVVTGALLSDASIFHYKTGLRMNLSQTGAEHRDWVYSVATACSNIGILARLKVYNGSKYPRGYVYMWTCNRHNLTLRKLHREWYPLGSKSVPESLTLTPLSLANWFMGDGSSSYMYEKTYVTVKLSTQGFSINETDLLASKLVDMGIIGAHKAKYGSYWAILVSDQDSVKAFMNLVEPYIVPSFQYKIKRPLW